MQPLPDHNAIACAQQNLQGLDVIQTTIDSLYELTDDCNDMHKSMIDEVVRLRTTTLKVKYDAEIRRLQKLRSEL